jgi:hypothetical protein
MRKIYESRACSDSTSSGHALGPRFYRAKPWAFPHALRASCQEWSFLGRLLVHCVCTNKIKSAVKSVTVPTRPGVGLRSFGANLGTLHSSVDCITNTVES